MRVGTKKRKSVKRDGLEFKAVYWPGSETSRGWYVGYRRGGGDWWHMDTRLPSQKAAEALARDLNCAVLEFNEWATCSGLITEDV